MASELRTHWRVLAACCTLALAAPVPLVMRPFSLYIESWKAEFGWTTAQISVAASIFVWTLALSAPFVGRIADRFSPKNVVRGFGVAYCASLIAIGHSTKSLPLFYFSFFCLGISGLGISNLVYTRIVSQYFRKSLGMALACLMLATASSAMVTPIALERILRADGWRWCWYYFAAGAFLDFLLISPRLPQNVARTQAPKSASVASMILRSRQFWVLSALGMFLVILAETCAVQLAPMVREAGVSAEAIGTCITLFGAGAMVGRLSTGFLLDRRPAMDVVLLSVFSAAGGLAMLIVGGKGLAAAACFLLGQSSGCEVDLVPYIVKQYFGATHFGEVTGYLHAICWFGAAAVVSLMGYSHDMAGSYKPMLVFLLGTSMPAIALARMLFSSKTVTGLLPE